ncbi:MAG: alpha/beta fold hydrolase [Coriobacteriales bacterium]|jgi:pimeloyl-ACP methyl ester carboxylesterase|nr:alpha/beta fold hydrolase [Coriobacteriales bacterium]
MARIEVNGSQVNVIEMNAGGGDPVVMLHGLFTNLSVYYFSIAPILAREHHVILYDLRSHGMSERRSEGYTLEMLSNDLLDLMETLHIPKAHLVGYSYGGAIALYTALTCPDKVGRLALIETPSLKEKTTHLLVDGSSRHDFDMIGEYVKSTGIAVSQAKAEQAKDLYRFLTKDGLLSAAVRQDQSFTDTWPLEDLRARTLLLYGAQSELLATSQLFASRIPKVTLHLAEGDHNLPVQQGDFLAHELEDFLRADAAGAADRAQEAQEADKAPGAQDSITGEGKDL